MHAGPRRLAAAAARAAHALAGRRRGVLREVAEGAFLPLLPVALVERKVRKGKAEANGSQGAGVAPRPDLETAEQETKLL